MDGMAYDGKEDGWFWDRGETISQDLYRNRRYYSIIIQHILISQYLMHDKPATHWSLVSSCRWCTFWFSLYTNGNWEGLVQSYDKKISLISLPGHLTLEAFSPVLTHCFSSSVEMLFLLLINYKKLCSWRVKHVTWISFKSVVSREKNFVGRVSGVLFHQK